MRLDFQYSLFFPFRQGKERGKATLAAFPGFIMI